MEDERPALGEAHAHVLVLDVRIVLNDPLQEAERLTTNICRLLHHSYRRLDARSPVEGLVVASDDEGAAAACMIQRHVKGSEFFSVCTLTVA